MADRFMSGQSTNKYEIPLPTEVSEKMAQIGSGITNVYEETKRLTEQLAKSQERTQNQIQHVEMKCESYYQNVIQKYDIVRAWYDQNHMTTEHVNRQFGFLICHLARSRFVRFLNFFFNWFHICIFEDQFGSEYRHDQYYALVYITDYDFREECCNVKRGSKEWKAARKRYIKNDREMLKEHLKKIKPLGYTLSNIKFRF